MNTQLDTVRSLLGKMPVPNLSAWSEGDIDTLFDVVSFD